MTSGRLCALLLGVGWVGCAAPPSASSAAAPPASPASPTQSEAERFFPLLNDTVFSYTAWLPESAEPEQLILQVERPSPSHANLRSGNTIKRLELVADGVRLITGGYLLKGPLVAGADWAGPAGRVRITAVDQDVRVAAGQFAGCLETLESDAQGPVPRAIATTYCPGVGIVKFSVDDGERQERFELKSFGPRVDVNAL
jgi:hypothetical protein